jgi:hypothetical protein
MTVIFINETSPIEPSVPPVPAPRLASHGNMSLDLPLLIFSPDPATDAKSSSDVATRQDETDSAEAVGDQAQHALLHGRYLGQVQARIERAWMRPRTPIGAPEFSCRAAVVQDRRGNPIDIRLQVCNGTQEWQSSLAAAIRTASPYRHHPIRPFMPTVSYSPLSPKAMRRVNRQRVLSLSDEQRWSRRPTFQSIRRLRTSHRGKTPGSAETLPFCRTSFT